MARTYGQYHGGNSTAFGYNFSRLLQSLGAPGGVLAEEQLADFDVAGYFKPEYPRLLRFTGTHPPDVQAVLARLRPMLAEHHALTGRSVAAQPASIVVRNALRKGNYELRWRGRAFSPLANRLLRTR